MKTRVLLELLDNDAGQVDELLRTTIWFVHEPAPWYQIRPEVNTAKRHRLTEDPTQPARPEHAALTLTLP